MQKRLSPGLFDNTGTTEMSEPATHSNLPMRPTHDPVTADFYKLAEEFKSVKMKTLGMESQLQVIKSQFNEFIHSMDQRFERVSQALSRLEKNIHQQEQSQETRLRSLSERLQNNRQDESKYEELMQRQTMAIRNFENQLSAMQRVVREKDDMLMKYYNALVAIKKQSQRPR